MPEQLTRRAFIGAAVSGALAALTAACARAVAPNTPAHTAPPPQPGPAATGVVPISSSVPITPNADFYTVTYMEAPTEVPDNWMLTVEGNVEHPLVLTLDDLMQMPAVTEMRTLSCISNLAGGTLIGNAVWKGVRLRDVLERAGVKDGTLELYLTAFDSYDTSIPLALARDEHSLLVYEMNGEPLPLEHGKPLRCLFPGRYGMKQPKWLQKITLSTREHRGYWEVQGWSKEAIIKPFSRIDQPDELATITTSSLTVSGIGFANTSGVAKIEVSLDDGKTWQETELQHGPSPLVWTTFEWSGATPPNGDHLLLSSTTDGDGSQQVRDEGGLFAATFPAGTAAMHEVPIRVEM
jgi:DMSO/TMAO reductase YedYZ molybdopterin-dependent catalytic subunit